MIYSHHPSFAREIRVAELNPDGKRFKPFPNAAWNTPRCEAGQYLDSVQGCAATRTRLYGCWTWASAPRSRQKLWDGTRRQTGSADLTVAIDFAKHYGTHPGTPVATELPSV